MTANSNLWSPPGDLFVECSVFFKTIESKHFTDRCLCYHFWLIARCPAANCCFLWCCWCRRLILCDGTSRTHWPTMNFEAKYHWRSDILEGMHQNTRRGFHGLFREPLHQRLPPHEYYQSFSLLKTPLATKRTSEMNQSPLIVAKRPISPEPFNSRRQVKGTRNHVCVDVLNTPSHLCLTILSP